MLSFTFEYGSWWRRTLAAAIDLAIILLVGTFLFEPAATALGFRAMSATMHKVPFSVFILRTYGVSVIFMLVFSWLYFSWMESSRTQATIGKQCMGLMVFTSNEGRLTFRKASVRFWVKLVSAAPIFLGCFFACFDEKRRALHDKLSRSIVIQRSSALDSQTAIS